MSRIKIELEKVLKERKISKNQLCYACKLQHTQLNNYCKNKVVRVDLATIAKICDYVGCSIADILVLEKDEEQEKEITEEDDIWEEEITEEEYLENEDSSGKQDLQDENEKGNRK